MKTKVLILADNPLAPSGIATQTKYMIEGLLKTGKYSFICLGGAIKHRDYSAIKFEDWGDDWVIYPVDGYGSEDIVRSIVRQERPDILWLMTDPRFWGWLWAIDNEIRPNVPMVYYHVWDNYPYPTFNKPYYESNDLIVSISRVTDDIIKTVVPKVDSVHIPHTVDTEIFKRRPREEYIKIAPDNFSDDRFVLFWNNRNARRKQSGTLIYWFKEFLDIVGHDKATLIMHTEPKDPNGQDLYAINASLNMTEEQFLLSVNKISPKELSCLYNLADCTINIADAEGFGLATLESLACETPIIVNMTGGLQEQVTNGEEYFGIGIEPVSKAIIGSQDVPWIYEDRCCKQDFLDALLKIYNLSKEERNNLGSRGRQHVLNNFGLDRYISKWDDALTQVVEKHGSWKTRKNYKSWKIREF